MNMKERAAWLRRELFEMVAKAGQGHLPSCFSCVEILVALYYGGVMRPGIDRLIVSKGHAAMAVYPVLADLGYFPRDELDKFTKADGILGMYADRRIPGIECVSGSLGHGLGIGAGMALADRTRNVFVILGDAECYEGSIWEAAMFAAHHNLANLTAVVDRNGLGILGRTEEMLSFGDLCGKWRSFDWTSYLIDGHDAVALTGCLDGAVGGPRVVIAHTVKGRGLSFAEGRAECHGLVMTPAQIAQGRMELA